jgi:hypothetical protein
MTSTTLPSGSNPSTPPLMLDAAIRSVRRGLARGARRSGTMFGEVGGRDGPVRQPRRPAGPPADLRAVRGRLLDQAQRLWDADRR